jgi:hypothetical protein
MARSGFIALMVVAGASFAGLGAATPAFAQFDQIFRGNPLEAIFGAPPRPPSDIPNRPPSDRRDPNYYPPQQGGLQPPGPPPNSRIRSEPLPPPGGYEQRVNLPPPTPGAPPPGQRPQQPQRGGTQQQQPAAPAPNAPPPTNETIIEPSAAKIPNPTAVFSGLDKITGRIISFDVAINETVRFGALEVTPRACFTRPPTEAPNTDGFIEVDELTLQGELKRIFTGWMFAASPGLNAVEHPIYDVWLTDCKGGAQPAIADAGPTPGPVPDQPPPQRPAPPRQQRAQQQPQQPGLPGQPPQPTQQRRPAPQTQQLPPPPGFQRQ